MAPQNLSKVRSTWYSNVPEPHGKGADSRAAARPLFSLIVDFGRYLPHARVQADQARYARYQAIKEEIAKLEAEMQGVDCEKVAKEHIKALNEVSRSLSTAFMGRSRADAFSRHLHSTTRERCVDSRYLRDS